MTSSLTSESVKDLCGGMGRESSGFWFLVSGLWIMKGWARLRKTAPIDLYAVNPGVPKARPGMYRARFKEQFGSDAGYVPKLAFAFKTILIDIVPGPDNTPDLILNPS
jgi:hypothetical protein